jgi:ribosomal protein L37E
MHPSFPQTKRVSAIISQDARTYIPLAESTLLPIPTSLKVVRRRNKSGWTLQEAEMAAKPKKRMSLATATKLIQRTSRTTTRRAHS